MSHSPEYRAWQNMKWRCLKPSNKMFRWYGGRGITICDRWLSSFANFYADMGPRLDPSFSIDRIDVDGNYEPSNCRWADRLTQDRNKTDTRYVMIDGVKHRAIDLAEKAGLKTDTVMYRVYTLGMTKMEDIVYRGIHGHANQFKGKKRTDLPFKTHCPHGHEYTPENTMIDHKGYKMCRACRKAQWTIRNRARAAAKKERPTS